MEKVVSTTRLKHDFHARGVIDYLSSKTEELNLQSSVLYYDFPLFRDYEETLFQPSLLLLDKLKGIHVIRIVSTACEVIHEDELLGEFHSLLYAKLLNSKRLRESRSTLKISISSILYLPPGTEVIRDTLENIQVSSYLGLEKILTEANSCSLTDEDFAEARSVIEGVKALAKLSPRDIAERELKPKALVIRKLEDEISNFDTHQRRAALTVTSGPQRIRGLAGSGKTIVLAWKVAHIHLTNPEKKILFTFYTRSLYDTIRKQITRFYRHFKDTDPNWDNVHVLHAWGGTRETGVYYDTCLNHGVLPKTFKDVREIPSPFKQICLELNRKASIKPKYDVVLVDEAQDMPDSFFEVLYKLTKGERDDKSIIWAYDELQSIFEPRMRSPVELFGVDDDGEPRVDLDRSATKIGLTEYFSNDLVLYKCYRNPLDVLVCAHAIGLGIYGPQVVQMLQNREHWEDVGYTVKLGDFTLGSKTILTRPVENSPLSILKFEQRDELIKIFCAPSFNDEITWIFNETQKFIDQGIRPEEILVICLDDRNAKNYFNILSQKFAQAGFNSNDILSNPMAASRFTMDGRITLSTVHKAKGNEAAVVFAAGIDAIVPERSSRKGRNKIFTAFTRAKCWLRVSGVNGQNSVLEPMFEEIKQAISLSPNLEFEWPDLTAVDTLQRDVSRREESAKKLQKEYLRNMAELGFSEDAALAALTVPEKSV